MNKKMFFLLGNIGFALLNYQPAWAGDFALDCPSRVRAGEQFKVSVAEENDFILPVKYCWDFDNRDSQSEFSDNCGAEKEYWYDKPGSYTLTAQALADGEVGVCQQCQIDVSNPELVGQVKIVELLPNPLGADNALAPEGEWVNLYNEGGEYVDLSGLILYDTDDTHELFLTSANVGGADSEGLKRGQILIAPKVMVTVYRNGDSDFSLNNEGDTVRLYSGPLEMLGELQSEVIYGSVKEGKMYRRNPDTGEWEESNRVVGQAVLGNQASGGAELETEAFCPVPEEGVSGGNANTNNGGSGDEEVNANESNNPNENANSNANGGQNGDAVSGNENINENDNANEGSGNIEEGNWSDGAGDVGLNAGINDLQNAQDPSGGTLNPTDALEAVSDREYRIPEEESAGQLVLISGGNDQKTGNRSSKKKSEKGNGEKKEEGNEKNNQKNKDSALKSLIVAEGGKAAEGEAVFYQGEKNGNDVFAENDAAIIGDENNGASPKTQIIAATPTEKSPWRWFYFLWHSWFFWRVILPFLILWTSLYAIIYFIQRKKLLS